MSAEWGGSRIAVNSRFFPRPPRGFLRFRTGGSTHGCTEKFKKINKPLGYYWLGGGNTSSPERTLRTILALEARYPNIALSSGQGSNNYLHSYIKGRAEYKLKSYNKAKKHFKLICWNRTPFLIYVKTLWMLLLINISS